MSEHNLEFTPRAPESKGAPQYYFNGFEITLGSGDVILNGMVNGKPCAQINFSFTIAKTLSQKLEELMAIVEQGEQKIMTVDEVGKHIQAARQGKEKA